MRTSEEFQALCVAIMAPASLFKESKVAAARNAQHKCKRASNLCLICHPTGVEYLHTDRPNAIALLGKDLVVWKDTAGKWHCFEDRCPHRLAPLSGNERNLPMESLDCKPAN